MRFMFRLGLVFTRRLGSFCIQNVAVDAVVAAAVNNDGDAYGRILVVANRQMLTFSQAPYSPCERTY